MSQKRSVEIIGSRVIALLREERRRQGVSMTTLATKTGLSQPTISYIEREMRNPTLDTLLRITTALNVSLSDVLRDAEKMGSKEK